MNNNTKTILRWTPSGLVTLMLLLSGISKISGHSPMADHFKEMKLDSFVSAFGTMEILFVLCFIFPRTMKAGLLLLTAYFGGAIAVELPFGSYVLAPMALLCSIWIAALVRRTDIFYTPVEAIQTSSSL